MTHGKAVAMAMAFFLVFAISSCKKADKPLVSPVGSDAQADPHAGVGNKAIPAGAGHVGRVLEVLSAGQYSYIQVDEQGKKLWIAAVAAKPAVGDEIEFADSPAFANFQSKILGRTFDTLIFVDGIRNNGKK